MAAHTWRLDAEIGLWHRYLEEARRIADGLMMAHCAHRLHLLDLQLAELRSQCEHVPNPERVERCYKCGHGLVIVAVKGPGPVKVRANVVVSRHAVGSS